MIRVPPRKDKFCSVRKEVEWWLIVLASSWRKLLSRSEVDETEAEDKKASKLLATVPALVFGFAVLGLGARVDGV